MWICIHYKRSHQDGGSSSFGRENLTWETIRGTSAEHSRTAVLRQTRDHYQESDVPLEVDSSRGTAVSPKGIELASEKVLANMCPQL